MKSLFAPCCFLLLLSCSPGHSEKPQSKPKEEAGLGTGGDNRPAASRSSINVTGTTIQTRFVPPPGFERTTAKPNTIATCLRELPLKPAGAPILLYDGSEKPYQEGNAGVVAMEIGKRNLQQCADAVMRLRSEYLFREKRYRLIHFNFTSGDRAEYERYAQGFRPVIKGNSVTWQKQKTTDWSYKTFRNYLDMVFTYAGTASLEKELQPVKNMNDVEIGDVLIQGGHPGHAVMVADVALNPKTGKKCYLLVQSYMPAQEIHVVKNPSDPALSPWYSSDVNREIKTPEWTFYPSNLKRFAT